MAPWGAAPTVPDHGFKMMTGGKRYLRVMAAAWLASVALGAGLAQAQDDRAGSGLFTGSIGPFRLFCGPQAPPAAPASKDDWSGESGSSGHPLM